MSSVEPPKKNVIPIADNSCFICTHAYVGSGGVICDVGMSFITADPVHLASICPVYSPEVSNG